MSDSELDEPGNLGLEKYGQSIEEGRFEDARLAMLEFLNSVAETIENDEELKASLESEPGDSRFLDAADWLGAESYYKDQLARSTSAWERSGRHSHLAALYSLLGREEEALEQARAAREAVRDDDMEIVQGTVLSKLAVCANRANRWCEAEAAAKEGLTIVADRPTCRLERVKCLIALARSELETGQKEEAAKRLSLAWELLEPQVDWHEFAGIQAVVADWWTVIACQHSANQPTEAAHDALAEAIVVRRRVVDAPMTEGPWARAALAESLLGYSKQLAIAGRPYDAQQAKQEAQEIRESLGLPA